MDFIKKLLLSSVFDIILVIVDQLTKQMIFISTHNTIISIYSLCVPSYITLDRGSEFVSNFFHSLGTTLNMWLYFTLGYYPKGNEQTKHMNQTLE